MQVREEIIIDAPADDVWSLISNYGQWNKWIPEIKVCQMTGEGLLRRRKIITETDEIFEEEITDVDDLSRTLEYRLVEPAGNFHGYDATLQVDAVTNHQCKVEFACDFQPAATAEGDVRLDLVKSARQALQGLKYACTGVKA